MQSTVQNHPVQRVEKSIADIDPILEAKGLSIILQEGRGRTEKRIVKNLSFTIRPGEMLGLAGESGSGKSISASAILGLLPKSLKITEGSIFLKGKELLSTDRQTVNRLRGKEIAYLFQNYQGSFTPFIKIGKQMVEAIRTHQSIGRAEAKKEALEWLDRVSLPAARVYESYPYELSGGQLQRAAIAAGLLLKPSLIIADEPTTALDVLTGETILDLLASLQKEYQTAVLLISHDLRHLIKRSDTLAIMYGGQIVEHGRTDEIHHNPEHPYTKMLLSARPSLNKEVPEKLFSIPGEPGQISVSGCCFSVRCGLAFQKCMQEPELKIIREGHEAACHALNPESGGR